MNALTDLLRWSPALRRMYLRSVLPMLLWLGAIILLTGSARHSTVAAWGLMLVAAACVLWLFVVYHRFLRECDELERQWELTAMAWGMCVGVTVGTVAFLALHLGLLQMGADHALVLLMSVVTGSYLLVRLILRWHYR